MAINDSGTRNQYTATAGQTVFPYTFEIFDKDDIKVQQKVYLTGVTTTLTEGTHYTVSGVDNDAGGNVTLITGAAVSDTITLSRDMALERLTDYQNSGDFLAAEVNSEEDRQWAAIQQIDSKASIGIRPTIDDPILNSTNTELADVATRAGKALGFNTDGTLAYLTSATSAERFQEGTAAGMINSSSPQVGDVWLVSDRANGIFDAKTGLTANGYDILQSSVDAGIQYEFMPYEDFPAESLGVVGDGSTDDSAAIAAVEAYASLNDLFPLYSEKTYIFDARLSLTKIKSVNAIFKLADSASVVGSISDELIEFPANAEIRGSKFTLDCNKASNAASPPTNGTVPGVGIVFNGGGHKFNHIKVINSWNGAVNHFTSNIGNIANTQGSILEADNCGGGIFLDANNQPAYINQIKVTNTNSEYTNAWSHALDIFHWTGGFVRSVYIDGCDGTSAAISAFFSGLTTKGNQDMEINQIIVKNFVDNDPSDLIPLAWSNLSSKNCLFENFHIQKFSENRHLEMTGMQGCTVRKGSIIADFNESYTSGAVPANTNGIIITDDTVDNFNNGRDHGASTDNVFEDIFMENMGFGVKDGGLNNTFRNVRAYGSLTHGYISQYVNENTAYYEPVTNPIYGGARIENCDFSYSNQAGIVITEDSRPMTIINTRTVGNGKDTTASITNRTGIRFDVVSDNLKHKIINHNGNEDANDLITTNLFSADEGNLFSDTRTFPCTKLDGGHDLRAGMRFVLTNADGGATDLPVRVEHASGAFDSFDLRPSASGASGTIQNGNNTALTGGSTFAGTINTRQITCTGGALRTEIIGKCHITVNGTLYRVAQVVDNNTINVEELIGASFSGASATLHVSSSTATTALQQRAVTGAQMTIDRMTFEGNAAANPTDQLKVGTRETRTINVGASSSGDITLDETYAENPNAVVSSNASVPGTSSVQVLSKTQVRVHNGAGFAADFTVKIDY